MKMFSEEVTEQAYWQAPMPAKDDIVVLAYVLGTMRMLNAQWLYCIQVAARMMPNARLRYVLLNQIFKGMRLGYDAGTCFSVHPDLFPGQFVSCFLQDDHGCQLVNYALTEKIRINEMIAGMVERPPCSSEFLRSLYQQCKKMQPFIRHPTLDILVARIRYRLSTETRELAERLIRERQCSRTMLSAMTRLPEHFDHFCVSAIGQGERRTNLGLALELLADPQI